MDYKRSRIVCIEIQTAICYRERLFQTHYPKYFARILNYEGVMT